VQAHIIKTRKTVGAEKEKVPKKRNSLSAQAHNIKTRNMVDAEKERVALCAGA
jgi:hypothetical protein